MTVEDYVREIVVRGLHDWIQAMEVRGVLQWRGVTAHDEIRNLTLAIVRAVLEQELMTIGTFVQGQFTEWQVPVEQALARVAREWDALGDLPGMGDLFWLSNTEKGDQRGREWQAEETS